MLNSLKVNGLWLFVDLLLLLFIHIVFLTVGLVMVVQSGLELGVILLTQPLKFWNYRCSLSCLASWPVNGEL